MRVHVTFAVGLLCAAALCRPAAASATQYWLGGRDPVNQRLKHLDTPVDYMDLFAPDAPWQQGATRLAVFKISTQSILAGPDDLLRTEFADMRRRHVAMAVEIGAVLRTSECGGGESFAPPDLMDRVGSRLQKLGLVLDYMAMDGPVWGGHERTWGRDPCTYPVPEVVRRVVRNVMQMRHYFPAIRAGEIEAVTDRLDPRQVVADYAQFERLFQQQTGTPIAFVHADVAWLSKWQPMMALLGRQVRALGIRFGVIVGGTKEDTTDASFVDTAMQNLRVIAADPAMRPDDIVVQSWQVLPTHMLPETQPSATGLLLRAENLLH